MPRILMWSHTSHSSDILDIKSPHLEHSSGQRLQCVEIKLNAWAHCGGQGSSIPELALAASWAVLLNSLRQFDQIVL